jgi:hypothetical protein
VTQSVVPFRGTGLARTLWTAALALLGAAAVLVVLYALFALGGSWSALLAVGLAWGCVALALLLWAGAALAAASGRGRLARPVLGLGLATFALAGAVSAASLPVTGERGIVLAVLVASGIGCVASAMAWRRTPPASTASNP